ncbi:ion transporter ['Osedax' symbiont bacterium Rs2_46_30_T18]|nr:ion transporter ['Osedax' symbiont bacterium Rs2_46_30_T18]
MLDINSIETAFARIRHNKVFELFVISIILFSALVIGVKTYDLPQWLITILPWLDHGVTLFFLIELSIRFIGEPEKRKFFRNPWNLFDTLIVVVSLIPVEDSELALIGRLIRIFRVLRMVSMIPELRLLLNSLIRALPQLGYVVLLMFIIFYIYAAAGSSFFAPINEKLWGDISIAMLTLFRVMTFEDWTDVMYETMEIHPFSWLFYLSFIFLTTFAFLNMVIGIVVNVMENEHSAAEKQKNLEQGIPTISDLQREIRELKQLIVENRSSSETTVINSRVK